MERNVKHVLYQRLLILIAAFFYYSGLVALFRWWQRHFTDSLVILGYHEASGGDLRSHLTYLKRHYRIQHLEQALDELYYPSRQHMPKDTGRAPLAVTFDDGYRDNYTVGFPLVRELGVPVTLFLASGYIESGKPFWWQEEPLSTHVREREIVFGGRLYHIDRQDEREALKREFADHVFYASSVAQREAYLHTVHASPSASSPTSKAERATFTWAEAREMETSGWVSFGAHTVHHPVLAYLTDMQELADEVRDCRAALERHLGRQLRCFAYPIGGFEHFGPRGLAMVEQAHYDWAVTAIEGFNTPHTNPYLLHRFIVDVNQHWLLVAAKTCGVWGFFTALCRFPARFVRGLWADEPLPLHIFAQEKTKELPKVEV